MNNQTILCVMAGILCSSLMSCGETAVTTVDDGDWVRRSSFEGVARSGAVAFVANDKAYVGLGYDGDDFLTDFWSYDPEANFWQRVTEFPGSGRTSAVAFAIAGKGYVGTGYDGEDEARDFWQYDVETNSWTQMADFEGSARLGAVGFSANDKGYVGAGFDGNYLKDFWEFSPASNSWRQILSMKGEKRENAVAFVINNQAYVGTGRNNGLLEYDFWQFDVEATDWYELEELDEDDDYTIVRHDAVAFTIGDRGFISVGNAGSNLSTTWEYDPFNDLWTEKTAFEGVARQGAVGFAIGNRAFVALGQNSSSRFDDIWEFLPDAEADDDN